VFTPPGSRPDEIDLTAAEPVARSASAVRPADPAPVVAPREFVDRARERLHSEWAALLDDDGRIVAAALPPGYEREPARPAVWRARAGAEADHFALIDVAGGALTLATGRRAGAFRADELESIRMLGRGLDLSLPPTRVGAP
jgi:hypothetical protein